MRDDLHIDPVRTLAALAPGLRALRATGILASLDDDRALRLLSSMVQPHFSDALLATLVEVHLRDAPGDDVVLHAGDNWSAQQLERALDRSLAGVLWDDAEWGYVHLVGHGCMRPAGPRGWLNVFEAALAQLGETRRFESFAVAMMYDEPLYLLVDQQQARVLARHHLLRGPAKKPGRLPAAIPGREATPPAVIALVAALNEKGVRAKAHGARIAVDVTLPDGGSLVERVRADLSKGNDGPHGGRR